MPVTHVNRKRKTYYLHAGTSKTGKPRYWFSTKADGDLVDTVPEGYEIYENPEAQVFLRKIVPQLVTPGEIAVVQEGLKRYAPGEHCLVDVQGPHIVIYHSENERLDPRLFGAGSFEMPEAYRHYMKVMRITLRDETDRLFSVERWCFRGAIDDWIDLMFSGGVGSLFDLVRKFCPHIGQESFFELI